mgnify:CR=1 FL=1
MGVAAVRVAGRRAQPGCVCRLPRSAPEGDDEELRTALGALEAKFVLSDTVLFDGTGRETFVRDVLAALDQVPR